MEPLYTKPVIRKNNPLKWYVEFHYSVPHQLWDKYPRKRIRFKKYDNINRVKGQERDAYAEEIRRKWEFCLKRLQYNPFEAELEELSSIEERTEIALAIIEESNKLSEEEKRKLIPIHQALEIFLESRRERIKNANSLSTYSGTVKWLLAYFEKSGLKDNPINSVSRLQISEALTTAKKEKKWSNTTYNKEIDFCMTIFNWLANEEYMEKNPAKGRIEKLSAQKSIHTWYDRDTAQRVKEVLLKSKEMAVYRACQFTYMICIRSKSELMKLKISDIDTTLKRVRFSAELSKNNREVYRDYTPEFEKVIEEMELSKYPSHYFIFGRHGEPSEHKCHKDYLADRFRIVRDTMKLSPNYTIYGWKHTRVVHEMMKKTDPYTIMHLCRHSDIQTTMDYMRDFDISLNNVYNEDDLKF